MSDYPEDFTFRGILDDRKRDAMTTPTPRTDAFTDSEGMGVESDFVPASFARQLERDHAARDAELAEWKRKAEEAERDAGKWQSIESAPKTGRTLLLGYVNELGNWRTMRGQWMDENYIAEYWEDPADDAVPGWYETSVNADDVPSCWMIDPTHWMPLPAPPSPEAPFA